MNESNPLMRLLSKAADALTAPQNMATPPRRAAQTVVEGPGQRNQSGYLGATQNGTLDGIEQQAPLSARARAELHPIVLPRPAASELDGVPGGSPKQSAAFNRYLTAQGYRFPKTILAKLQELDPPWRRLQDAIALEILDRNGRYHTNLADIAKRTADGDLTAQEADGWSREDFLEDSRERVNAFKGALREIESNAWKIALPAMQEKCEFAMVAADRLDEKARAWFDEFETPPHPLSFVLQLRKFALSLTNDSRAGGLPSGILENL